MCDAVVTTWANGGLSRYCPRHLPAMGPQRRIPAAGLPHGDVRTESERCAVMGVDLLLLTNDPDPTAVLPALGLLSHKVRSHEPDVASLLEAGPYDAVLVDARVDLVALPAAGPGYLMRQSVSRRPDRPAGPHG